MKRFISIFAILVTLGITAHAEIIGSGRAAEVAARVFGTSKVPEAPVWSSAQLDSRPSGEQPLFYAFNNPDGGWAIIAGDDCAEPVVAFSDSGEFVPENMPEHVVAFFEKIAANIDCMRREKHSSEEIARAWKNAGARTKAPQGKLLITANWGQSYPYNNLCPEVEGSRAVTGCTQTAYAIVMRYFEWPEYPVSAILPDYTYVTKTGNSRLQTGHAIGDIKYNWARMPLDPSEFNKASSATLRNIAQLMLDLGVCNHARYNGSGTSTHTDVAEVNVPIYMKYKRSATRLQREHCHYIQWCDSLKKSIDNDIPLIYNDYGHSYVMDGYTYDAQGLFFHFNLGWEGYDNGYYSANTVDAKVARGYYETVLGFVPDYEEKDSGKTEIRLVIRPSEDYKGFNIVNSANEPQYVNIKEGSSYRILASRIFNQSGYASDTPVVFDGTLQIIHYRADGTPVEAVGAKAERSASTSRSLAVGPLNGVLHNISFGDYLGIGYIDEKGTFEPDQYTRQVIGVTANGTDKARIPTDQVFVIDIRNEYQIGEAIILTDAVRHATLPHTSVTWAVNGEELDSDAAELFYVPQTAGTYEFTATVKTDSYGEFKISKLTKVE